MFDQVEAVFGGIDVVVHTAGIMLLSPLTDLNLDDFDRMHRTNVRGTFVVDGKPAEVVDNLRSMSPLERLGEPADIAETVAFLAGPARWVNGQIIYANGGVIDRSAQREQFSVTEIDWEMTASIRALSPLRPGPV